MRAFSIGKIENTVRKNRKRSPGPLSHSRTHSISHLHPSALEGHFEENNYMLEMLFSSRESLNVL